MVIRGAGDLATGVALQALRAGWRVLMTELPQPMVVRRAVSFAEAVYAGSIVVDGVTARQCNDRTEVMAALQLGHVIT